MATRIAAGLQQRVKALNLFLHESITARKSCAPAMFRASR